jgi:hypothetical protein
MKTTTAKIIGAAENFDFLQSLRDAVFVTLVVAFAKKSGWNAIKDALLSGKTQLEVVVGLNFEITDPDVLSEWLKVKAQDPYRFTIEVAPRNPVFHPKVILVRRADGSRFALVGSGNLTGGGLATNVECGALIEDEAQLDELEVWCSQLARTPLSAEIIEEYREVYSDSLRALWKQRGAVSKLNRLLSPSKSPETSKPIPVWDAPTFLKDMDAFLETDDGIAGLRNRTEGAKDIRSLLGMPTFDFSKHAWEDFYRIVEFGRIRQGYKSMSSEVVQLRKTLRLLTARHLDERTLEEILAVDGKHHVRGLGTNIVSKVLTVHDRKLWPLFNHRVKKTVEQYGYRVDWGAHHYLAFATAMRRVLARQGQPDFWAMDVFCEWRSRDP